MEQGRVQGTCRSGACMGERPGTCHTEGNPSAGHLWAGSFCLPPALVSPGPLLGRDQGGCQAESNLERARQEGLTGAMGQRGQGYGLRHPAVGYTPAGVSGLSADSQGAGGDSYTQAKRTSETIW